MNDTNLDISNVFAEKMMRKDGVERLKMGASMFESAKTIALASFSENISDREKKIFLFRRIYGNDFTAEETDEICKQL